MTADAARRGAVDTAECHEAEPVVATGTGRPTLADIEHVCGARYRAVFVAEAGRCSIAASFARGTDTRGNGKALCGMPYCPRPLLTESAHDQRSSGVWTLISTSLVAAPCLDSYDTVNFGSAWGRILWDCWSCCQLCNWRFEMFARTPRSDIMGRSKRRTGLGPRTFGRCVSRLAVVVAFVAAFSVQPQIATAHTPDDYSDLWTCNGGEPPFNGVCFSHANNLRVNWRIGTGWTTALANTVRTVAGQWWNAGGSTFTIVEVSSGFPVNRVAPSVCSGGCAVGFLDGSSHVQISRIDIANTMLTGPTAIHEFGHAAGLGHGIPGWGNVMGSSGLSNTGAGDRAGICQTSGHSHNGWGSCVTAF